MNSEKAQKKQRERRAIVSTAVVVPLLCRWVQIRSNSTVSATGTTSAAALLLVLVCIKQFHRHYREQSALLNRHCRGVSTVVAGQTRLVCFFAAGREM